MTSFVGVIFLLATIVLAVVYLMVATSGVALLLGEPLGVHDFVGSAAVAFGIYLVQRA